MTLKLEVIDFRKYTQEKEQILELARGIWNEPKSSANVVHSIERWMNKKEAGVYFYIILDGKKIGITGYWPIRINPGSFGLRHHGTTVKGTGKKALDILIKYLQETYGESFKHLIEFIPEGREELIQVFTKWGFEFDPKGVPEWEPKRDYYKYSMVLTPK